MRRRNAEPLIESWTESTMNCMGGWTSRLLLRLIDLENAIRDETSLRSFTNGYRLAIGINRALSDRPPFSFAKEEEEHARVLNEEEHPM